MTLIVNPKNKTEEKVLKAFLSSLKIGFHTQADEDEALHKAMLAGKKTKLLTRSEKEKFLHQLSTKK